MDKRIAGRKDGPGLIMNHSEYIFSYFCDHVCTYISQCNEVPKTLLSLNPCKSWPFFGGSRGEGGGGYFLVPNKSR